MKKYLLTFILILSGCGIQQFCSLPTEDITDMYASYIDEWKTQCKQSFDEAEKRVFAIQPKPNVPDNGPIPNEDPAKCPCKGSGVITHGDGHKTPCPFHSKSLKLR